MKWPEKNLEDAVESGEIKIGDVRKSIAMRYGDAPTRQALQKILSGKSAPSLEVGLLIWEAYPEINPLSLIPVGKRKYVRLTARSFDPTADELGSAPEINTEPVEIVDADSLLEGLLEEPQSNDDVLEGLGDDFLEGLI